MLLIRLLLALAFFNGSSGFTPAKRHSDAKGFALKASALSSGSLDRAAFLSATTALLVSTAAPKNSCAEDEAAIASSSKQSRGISGCPKPISGKPNNCVSTSNVKQVDTYMPPWTFEVSADEALARLKGAIAADPAFTVIELDEDERFIRVEVQRTFKGQDEMQFIVKGDDKVVIFQSFEKDGGTISDFGANRNRVESLRKKIGVFDIMGKGMTADSYGSVGADRGGGALGQLKAFYGLQSGKGFQDVFEE